MKIDFIIDLSYGDCGKGKISKILNDKYNYSSVIKFNGSGNAGHAVWINDKKYTAHYLTSGIYNKGSKIIIGPGCVLNIDDFLNEYKLFDKDFNLKNRVFIHPYTHIITKNHVDIDKLENKIGTTNKGNGPCYSDKYKRTGTRAESIKELSNFILPDKFVKNIFNISENKNILMEGSQGWWLDIDHGNYPYVTSSHIHPGYAFATFGIPLNTVGDIYGVCKIYDTYVGNSNTIVYSTENDEFKIREKGNEYGETTGRPRKIGYLNLNKLIDAINQVGVNKIFINKIDVLDDLKIFKLMHNNEILNFPNIESMKNFIIDKINLNKNNIIFSGKKDGDDILL